MCWENFKFFIIYSVCVGLSLPVSAGADVLALDSALNTTYNACVGISNDLTNLKKMAGINTAVTAVGTVAGGVALGAGIAKANVDQEQKALEEKVARLIAEKSNIPIETIEIADQAEFQRQLSVAAGATNGEISADQQKIAELEQKSKTLGNVRTGTLATSTATNVAGSIIAGTNNVDKDLENRIENCKKAVDNLQRSVAQARMDGEDISKAQRVITACKEYNYVDISTINSKSKGAMISSIVGATTGAVGTITSASANSDSIRADNTESGKQKEQNLNTTSNIMAGTATVASVGATIFNATQIGAIKKLVTVADKCEEAFK